MKQIFLHSVLSFAILFFGKISAQETFSKDAISQKLLTTEGSEISFGEILKQSKNKNTVIEVWASWCGDCVKAMPHTKEFQAENPDVSFIFISMDKTAEKWKEGIEKHQLKGLHYMAPDGMKGNFGKAINLDWIPRYIIIDKKGKIVLYRAVETDFAKMKEVIKQIK